MTTKLDKFTESELMNVANLGFLEEMTVEGLKEEWDLEVKDLEKAQLMQSLGVQIGECFDHRESNEADEYAEKMRSEGYEVREFNDGTDMIFFALYKPHTNYVLSVQWYVENGWYGDRYRVILQGEDGQGYKTKTEARKMLTMLKKFVKTESRYPGKEEERNPKCFNVEVKKYDDLETYRYCGAGPSWSCSNLHVDYVKFMKFVEKEEKRLAEGRERRKWESERRQSRSERSASMRRGREARMRR